MDYFGDGEKLAVVEQGTADPQGMGFACEKIASLLAKDLSNADEIFQLSAPPPEKDVWKDAVTLKRDLIVGPPASFRKKQASDYNFELYISYEHTSHIDEWVRAFLPIS